MEGINDIILNHRRQQCKALAKNGRSSYPIQTQVKKRCGESKNEMGSRTDSPTYYLKCKRKRSVKIL